MGDTVYTITIILIWVFALCFHEWAHAKVAFMGGDESVVDKGYLSFNPLKYMEPFNSIIFPIIILLIGGVPLPGGAVWIETHRIRSREWLSLMSLAGPLANLVLAFAIGAAFRFGLVPEIGPVGPILAISIYFQLFAVFLNLLPLPGLDGFGALAPWLPRDVQDIANRVARFMPFVILLIAFQTRLFSKTFLNFAVPILEGFEVPLPLISIGFGYLPVF